MMAKLILGILIGAGLAFTVLALIEKDEQKKLDDWERWESKLP